MGYAEKLYEKVKTLPESVVSEIFDFANFLEMRQARGEAPIANTSDWGAETLRLVRFQQNAVAAYIAHHVFERNPVRHRENHFVAVID